MTFCPRVSLLATTPFLGLLTSYQVPNLLDPMEVCASPATLDLKLSLQRGHALGLCQGTWASSLSKHTYLPFPGVIEKRDSEPLLNVLNMVGGWPVAMDKWNETVGKYRPVCRLQGKVYSTPKLPTS